MDDSMSAASTIPVINSSRDEHRSRGRRGVNHDVLERGVAALDAIHAANERTAAYKHELDNVRVALGRAEDHIKDLLRVTPDADRLAPADLPPSVFAAELLKRDAMVNKWTDAYYKLVEAAALERAERKSERSRLEAEIQRLERRADRLSTENREQRVQRDRRPAPDPALAEARRERDEARAGLDKTRTAHQQALLTARNDVNYYIHKANKHQSAELDAQRRFLDQRQLVLTLQARLQQSDALAPTLPPAGVHLPAGGHDLGDAAFASDYLDTATFALTHENTSAFDTLSEPSDRPRIPSPAGEFPSYHHDDDHSDSRSSSGRG
jgi:hypothetical protein